MKSKSNEYCKKDLVAHPTTAAAAVGGGGDGGGINLIWQKEVISENITSPNKFHLLTIVEERKYACVSGYVYVGACVNEHD